MVPNRDSRHCSTNTCAFRGQARTEMCETVRCVPLVWGATLGHAKLSVVKIWQPIPAFIKCLRPVEPSSHHLLLSLMTLPFRRGEHTVPQSSRAGTQVKTEKSENKSRHPSWSWRFPQPWIIYEVTLPMLLTPPSALASSSREWICLLQIKHDSDKICQGQIMYKLLLIKLDLYDSCVWYFQCIFHVVPCLLSICIGIKKHHYYCYFM